MFWTAKISNSVAKQLALFCLVKYFQKKLTKSEIKENSASTTVASVKVIILEMAAEESFKLMIGEYDPDMIVRTFSLNLTYVELLYQFM
jgi:hypothetical protein